MIIALARALDHSHPLALPPKTGCPTWSQGASGKNHEARSHFLAVRANYLARTPYVIEGVQERGGSEHGPSNYSHSRRWARLPLNRPYDSGMTRDEVLAELAALEDRSGLGRREFTRAAHAHLGTPRGWLSVSQAAEALGVSERYVRQLCAQNDLRHQRNAQTGQTWISPYSVQGRLAQGRFKAKAAQDG